MPRAICVAVLGALLTSSAVARNDPGESERSDEVVDETGEAAPGGGADEWTIRWDDGFEVIGPDGISVLEFGGRIMSDWAAYSPDDELETEFGSAAFDGGSEFRRARLFFAGELYGRVEFKAQYDFAGGDPEFKDVYVGLVDLPALGGLRIGHYKEPFSLEEQTSSKYITFMERSLPVEAFSPSYNSGLMLHDSRPRFTWAAGLFQDADDFGDSADAEDVSLTGRVTCVPWRREDRLLHLGLAASRRQPSDDSVRFSSRPESHITTRLVSTESFASDATRVVGLEAASVIGPFSVQGEYVRTTAERLDDGPDLDFDGAYLSASWFVTGETRPYDNGAFGRVKPASPLDSETGAGIGAWEIALRYSTLDLTDGDVVGGELDDVTLGLNWYLYDNVRAMVNYVLAEREDGGTLDAGQVRFQIDF